MSDNDEPMGYAEIAAFHQRGEHQAEPKAEPKAEIEAAIDEPETEAETEAESKAEIKAKGKTIPLARHEAVLQKQRDQFTEATNRINALEAKIAELSEKPETPENVAKADVLNERLARLREDLPEGISEDLVGALEEQLARSAKQDERLARQDELLKQMTAERQEIDAQWRKTEREKAINSVPDLVAWQAAALRDEATEDDIAVWEKAKRVDKALKALPEWQEEEPAERFKMVASIVRADLRESASKATASKATSEAVPKALPTAKASAPASLSSIPGGAPPADSNLDAYLADPMKMAAMRQRMTSTQWDAFTATLK